MADAEPVPNTSQSQETAAQGAESKKEGQTPAEFNPSTTVGSMGDLKAESPELYKAIQEGIALRIIGDQRKHNARMKEINREAQRQSRG
jgi:hypothetical protein